MSRPVLVDDLGSIIADLKRRLIALERSAQLPNSSISTGGLTIKAGGIITLDGGALDVKDGSGIVRVRVGKDGSDYDVKVYDAAGANPVKLSTLAFGIDGDIVDTFEQTSSSTLTDLATVGPAVTVTIGPSGRMIVLLSAHIRNAAAGFTTDPIMGYAISGATVRAASVGRTLGFRMHTVNHQFTLKASEAFIEEGLTAGVHTVTAKYAEGVGSGENAAFEHRKLIVIPY